MVLFHFCEMSLTTKLKTRLVYITNKLLFLLLCSELINLAFITHNIILRFLCYFNQLQVGTQLANSVTKS